MEMKTCLSCKNSYPPTLEYFYKCKISNSGLRGNCKKCMNEHTTMRAKEKQGMINELYESIDRDGLKKKCGVCYKMLPATKEHYYVSPTGKYYLRDKCKGCFNEQSKENKQKPEYKAKQKEYAKRVYKENKHEINKKCREHYRKNVEYHKNRSKQWRKNNPEKARKQDKINWHIRRQSRKEALYPLTEHQWNKILEYFNGECCYCGSEDNITRDHFIPVTKGGQYDINNMIPACMTCNISKSNHDFFEWYKNKPYYSKKREKKILSFLGYMDSSRQQMSMF